MPPWGRLGRGAGSLRAGGAQSARDPRSLGLKEEPTMVAVAVGRLRRYLCAQGRPAAGSRRLCKA